MPFSFASGTITVTGGATSGTATSGASTTLTDTSKSWTTNQWAGRHVWIHTGTGAGQWRVVSSPYSSSLDAFYSSFSGGQLAGLIVSRG